MKVRKGNSQLSELAKSFAISDSNASHIEISSVVIKPWLKELIRPRTISEQSNLKADIEVNGLTTPIVLANIDGEENCLVDGHGRLECYQQLQRNTIPFTIKNFSSKEEITAWIYRKQLGRRNLTKQDRAYLIGSLQDSKASIAKELEIGTTKIAEARSFYKAVNWLVKNQYKSKDELLQSSISSVIQLHQKLNSQSAYTESVQAKKSVNWKLDPTLVSRLKDFVQVNNAQSISQQVESILREYLDTHGN